jgi:hypothetical protein
VIKFAKKHSVIVTPTSLRIAREMLSCFNSYKCINEYFEKLRTGMIGEARELEAAIKTLPQPIAEEILSEL